MVMELRDNLAAAVEEKRRARANLSELRRVSDTLASEPRVRITAAAEARVSNATKRLEEAQAAIEVAADCECGAFIYAKCAGCGRGGRLPHHLGMRWYCDSCCPAHRPRAEASNGA